jgi:hypothetical protein
LQSGSLIQRERRRRKSNVAAHRNSHGLNRPQQRRLACHQPSMLLPKRSQANRSPFTSSLSCGSSRINDNPKEDQRQQQQQQQQK